MSEKINYAVGFYWGNGTDQVGLYSHINDYFYGTIEEARQLRDYCQARPDNIEKRREYKIFQLVELPK